ncbi:hypothetical protein KAFR_0K01940 [Kazachstania africana CBS 2517]|uniref:LSM complex subunit LSM4 n=1 Tax=Kazachstania africana (strain ATCC 22294 / BCRC 22015 / CBS 2517 / CECT 1963 / NBRC 1671 / NRRL Y-8276) TaxID=1071382 RepID=H2B1P8_KAZAF|nr:hypothetical protein KAFR_0K01940 [Kazachstania africana CBS 2517]CCF60548.1 hypothetical protein KAFR_0K01940 [Kazachstania africana CBS 2517]
MLPLYLLTNAKGQQMRVELKSGEIIEGELTNVDNWMNLTLRNISEYKNTDGSPQLEVVKSSEIYLKGIYIKYIKLQDDIINNVKQQINSNMNTGGNKTHRNYNNRNYMSNNQNNRRNTYGTTGNNMNNRRGYNNASNNVRRGFNQNNQMRRSNNGLGGYVQHNPDVNLGDLAGKSPGQSIEF